MNEFQERLDIALKSIVKKLPSEIGNEFLVFLTKEDAYKARDWWFRPVGEPACPMHQVIDVKFDGITSASYKGNTFHFVVNALKESMIIRIGYETKKL